MSALKDETGNVYGKLTVIERAEDKIYGKDKRHFPAWRCLCECGNEVVVVGQSLRRGLTVSCGCRKQDEDYKLLQKEKQTIHGERGTRLYDCWRGMKKRCLNPNDDHYPGYGGRGITICEEWRDNYVAFSTWAKENGYSDDLTLDRIDVNGNYEPSNCRWATAEEQQRNKRNNRLITFNGETLTLVEWSERTGINRCTITNRIDKYGWSVEDALTIPPRK